jgi:hypothetical protein
MTVLNSCGSSLPGVTSCHGWIMKISLPLMNSGVSRGHCKCRNTAHGRGRGFFEKGLTL